MSDCNDSKEGMSCRAGVADDEKEGEGTRIEENHDANMTSTPKVLAKVESYALCWENIKFDSYSKQCEFRCQFGEGFTRNVANKKRRTVKKPQLMFTLKQI